jgi:transposase
VSAYHVLQDGVSYQELGGDYFLTREDRERITQRLVRQLERLGQTVTLEPTTVEAG